MISKRRWLVMSVISLISMVVFFSMSMAQVGKKADTGKAKGVAAQQPPDAKKAADEAMKAEQVKMLEEMKQLAAEAKQAADDAKIIVAVAQVAQKEEPKKGEEPKKVEDAKKEEKWDAPNWMQGKDKDGKVGPDPRGDLAGTIIAPAPDGNGDKFIEKMSPGDLYERIAHNFFSINLVWTLITGFLVMFMQAGFALVETGLCRAKNAAHTMSMNFMIYPLGCLAFWVYGFAIGWGNWNNGYVQDGYVATLGSTLANLDHGIGFDAKKDDKGEPTGAYTYGLLGTKGFFLNGLEDTAIMSLFFFMMVFMDTTATIPTGAMAERWAWKNFVIYGLWVALPYCIYANWVWGGGWLAQAGKNWGLGHGAVDFAGSGVVHAMGGFIGLAGAMVIGPRIGKYINGKPQAIPGHHIPMVMLGTFILALGWFGFNPGSTLSGTDLRISIVVVNTMLAGVAAAFSAMLFMQIQGMKPDPSMMCNGMLAGLVAITAPCAFVSSAGAVIIGLMAGVFVVLSVFFWDKAGVDDPVGAISVHGINGLWGVISVGIFANGNYGDGWNGVPGKVTGILYGDHSPSQLYAQLLDAAVVAIFGFVMAYVWFQFSNLITPIRVSRETELAGLDNPEMGALGYPDFVLTTHGAAPSHKV